jgi:hypothetical protein
MTELDRVPVAQLPSKYGIVKSVLYDRINRLGIKPQKIGNKSYLSGEQLELLDQLDAHINAGGSMAEFAERHTSQSGGQSDEPKPQPESGGQSGSQLTATELTGSQVGKIPQLIEGLVARLVPAIVRQIPSSPLIAPDPVAYLRALEEAYRNGWLLSTSELAALLKLSPATVRGYGEQFEDAGFVFTRAGTRKRGEVACA